ncbi:MAG: protein-glutamate O-methyltransferase CheR [Enterobacterales bacterium]|nr:protein-glutamate O-methyltransferase CheR [Enterobacterales bacterium]
MSVAENNKKHREFLYRPSDFERVVRMIYKVSGISLSDRKQDMVYSRLARRLRKLALVDFHQYLEFVKQDKDEQREFVNALTTNLTHFFREDHHFEYLTGVFFPEIFAKNTNRIRFWSAGCSTGEEPYTLAMVWEHLQDKPSNVDFKILATDLDTNVIDSGKDGIYSLDKLEPVAEAYQKWFCKTDKCSPNQKQVHHKLKQSIHFKQLNLMADWPMKGPFQLIICRNVLIYFDKPTQEKLIQRYYDLLEPKGCLILGHSESLGENRKLFKNCGKTIFRKLD